MLLLENAVMVPLKPAKSQGWFEMSGPLDDGGMDVETWLADNDPHWAPVDGAKVVGLHDNADMLANDARLNGKLDGSIVVADGGDGKYMLVVEVNSLEAALFRHAGVLLKPGQA